ncbi:Aste57867_11891 [Aphanomyces stellatus]|uniref:Aste57867_11891 protein n=1 Tax=Aphanomyces stellatus TaxID=120398 RepID=A0A485KU62_9STRA|nr:hypothetical protein As57867_011846 [Aphanomyces stellatus]VFT88746.1 Aste57867_11891 [Aphanomyces stellatus]
MFRVATRLTRALPALATKATAINGAFLPTAAKSFTPRFAVPMIMTGPVSFARFFTSESEAPKSKLFVRGLPWDTEEEQLRELFEKYGDIVSIDMMKRRDGRPSGSAFVVFAEESEAQAALELDGEAVGSRYMNVLIAEPRAPRAIITERPADCTAIRFSNVPFNITEENIRSMFEHCGEIAHVHFMKDKDTGRLLGTGFVEFVDPESTDKALNVSGADAFGRQINVAYSTRAKRPAFNNHKPQGCKSVYVGNLSEDVDSSMLESLFEDCGEIERVVVATDRETGEPRGFGYVNFAHTDAVDEAVKLSGSDIAGQAIRVNFAREREDRRAPRENNFRSGDRSSSRGYGRTKSDQGYGGRAKYSGRDEGRFKRNNRGRDSDY